MLSLLLMIGAIQFGEVKACSDPSITALDTFQTKVEYLGKTSQLFAEDRLKVRASLPSACSYVNSESEVKFDVTSEGQITNYKVLFEQPVRIHSRVIKRAILKTPVNKSAWGTSGNRVRVMYVQYKNKAEQTHQN